MSKLTNKERIERLSVIEVNKEIKARGRYRYAEYTIIYENKPPETFLIRELLTKFNMPRETFHKREQRWWKDYMRILFTPIKGQKVKYAKCPWVYKKETPERDYEREARLKEAIRKKKKFTI